jgi:hypothetical protein
MVPDGSQGLGGAGQRGAVAQGLAAVSAHAYELIFFSYRGTGIFWVIRKRKLN